MPWPTTCALVGLGKQGETRRAFAAIVSSNYFSVIGVPLARGRTFTAEEETPGRNTSGCDRELFLLAATKPRSIAARLPATG